MWHACQANIFDYYFIDRHTIFVNIGRGSVISEESLVNALQMKWLAGAILDVHENEPLQKESVLWTMENVRKT